MIGGIRHHQSPHQGCCQLITNIKPSRPAQRRILLQIRHRLMVRGPFYRPNRSANAAIHSGRRRPELPDGIFANKKSKFG
jgi:hypothetical protein